MNKQLIYYTAGFLSGLLLCIFVFAGFLSDHMRNGGTETSLKFAHALPTNHPVHLGIEFFAERVGELSGGDIEVVVFPSGQLGDETKSIENIQNGTLDLTKTSTATLGNFLTIMKLFSLPYLFEDSEHYWQVLNGEIGNELLAAISKRNDGESSGIVGLGYFDSGSRCFYTTRPIRTPEDLQGMKLRVARDPVAMDIVSAFGASPTPIPWGEIYTALKQGVVDGAENNLPSFFAARHYEVCKYFTFDHHTRIPDIIVMSEASWQKLNDQQKQWITQAMQDATIYQRQVWQEAEVETIDALLTAGVELIDVNIDAFRAATGSVIENYAEGSVATYYNRIISMQ